MENKKDFLTLFFMCAFLTSIVGVFLAFFLSKYNEEPLFTFSKENYIYEIVDKTVSLNWEEKLVSNISNEQNVYLKIKENDLREGKIYLTIITYVNYHGHQYLNPQIIFNEP